MLDLGQIGEQITSARKARKISQSRLAELAGVSLRTVTLLENGRAAELGFSKLARILAAVGLEFRLGPVATQRPTLDDLMQEDAGNDQGLDR